MYAICRVKKLKSYDIGKVGAHNDRAMSVPHSNPEIKTNTRWTKFSPGENLVSQVKLRLDEVSINKHRKDAVVAVEILMTASPEFFRPSNPEAHGECDPQRLKQWKSRTEAFLREKYGNNLVEMTLHLDEATPHIHAIVVPAVTKTKSKRRTKQQIMDNESAGTYEEGSLDAKKMFDKFELINLQTDYAKSVEDLGLERGMRGSSAIHQAVKDFYTMVNSDPKKRFKPEDILDPNVFKNLDVPLFGKDEFFKNLYKTVIKKVEKNLSFIANRYVKQIDSLTKQLNTEKDRSKWFSKRFGSPEKAQAAYENMDKKLKSVSQEKKDMADLLEKTKLNALNEAQQLKTKLNYAEARVSQLEAENRQLKSPIKKPVSPFSSKYSKNDYQP